MTHTPCTSAQWGRTGTSTGPPLERRRAWPPRQRPEWGSNAPSQPCGAGVLVLSALSPGASDHSVDSACVSSPGCSSLINYGWKRDTGIDLSHKLLFLCNVEHF